MKGAPWWWFGLGSVVAVGAAIACGNDTVIVSQDAGAIDAAQVALPGDADDDSCGDAGVPPSTLECAGLYSNFGTKTISPKAISYAPAIALWSDGAGKERWIELPAGSTIDVTNPSEWVFPVGTKLFKQFTYQGHRVETRLFQKITDSYWVHATYAWNAAETATKISYGETVSTDSDGGTWLIPKPTDCDSCHRGRTDRVLGFEQVSLGLPGATGLTLSELAARKLIEPTPAVTNLQIGDDGSGLAAPALAWMHVNCGITCHSANVNSLGYGAKMLLRLDPTLLDGSPPNATTWDPIKTTLGIPCISGSVAGQPRIVAGDPVSSVIVQLMSSRGALQMPPLATRFVDHANVAVISEWIRQMPVADAGPLPEDAGFDAGAADAGGVDAAVGEDASAMMDAGSDANEPDADNDGGTAVSLQAPDDAGGT